MSHNKDLLGHTEHTECLPDEFFKGNFDPHAFECCGWETKRRGKEAFDKDGKLIGGQFPVFIKRSEYQGFLLVQAELDKKPSVGPGLRNGKTYLCWHL